MQGIRLISAIAAVAALASGAAMAETPSAFNGKATLAQPASAKETLISGVSWTCSGADCSGYAERYSSLESRMKECKKVAAELGPLTAYFSRGVAMSKGDLSVCNKAASGVQTAQSAQPNGN